MNESRTSRLMGRASNIREALNESNKYSLRQIVDKATSGLSLTSRMIRDLETSLDKLDDVEQLNDKFDQFDIRAAFSSVVQAGGKMPLQHEIDQFIEDTFK